ncbi:aspartate/glutamate racemase family protein, partial [Thermodesulfobacteriota bacterium]
MAIYKTRISAESYGHTVGIILIDCRCPFIPGDVGNASTYSYPVLYKTIPGLTASVIFKEAPEFNDLVVDAACELADNGVKIISSDCGFMLQYQENVRKVVDLPVVLSSLLQLPFIASTMNPSHPIGIITADAEYLSKDFLSNSRIKVKNPLIIKGLQKQPEFRRATIDEKGTLDSDMIRMEVVKLAQSMIAEYSDMGAILLECSMLPPYAKAVQETTGLPVYDFITMIDYVQAVTYRKS